MAVLVLLVGASSLLIAAAGTTVPLASFFVADPATRDGLEGDCLLRVIGTNSRPV